MDFAINATPLERYMPEERVGLKYRLWRIVESTPFEYFIMTLIVLNTILLMMKVRRHHTMTNYLKSVLIYALPIALVIWNQTEFFLIKIVL